GGLDRHAGEVDALAGVGLGGRGQRADLAAGQGHRGAVAEVVVLERGERVEVGGAGERLVGRGGGVVERALGEQRGLFRIVRIIAVRHRTLPTGDWPRTVYGGPPAGRGMESGGRASR